MKKRSTVGIYCALGIMLGMHAMEYDLAERLREMSIESSKREYYFLTADEQKIAVPEHVAFLAPALKDMIENVKKSGLIDKPMQLDMRGDVFKGIVQVLARLDSNAGRRGVASVLNHSSDWIGLIKNRDKRAQFFKALGSLGLHDFGRSVVTILHTINPMLWLRSSYYKDVQFDLQQCYHCLRKRVPYTEQKTLSIKGVAAVAVSPEGGIKFVAVLDGKTIKIYDPNIDKYVRILELHSDDGVTSVVFNADHTRLAISWYDGTINIWDLGTGQCIYRKCMHIAIAAIALNPDDNSLAIALNGSRSAVEVWGIKENAKLLWYSYPHPVSVAFSPDGVLIAIHYRNYVEVWNVDEHRWCESKVRMDRAQAIAFGPRELMAIGFANGIIDIQNFRTGYIMNTLQCSSGGLRSVFFTPDGRWLVSCLSDKIALWDFKEHESCLKGLNPQQELLLLALEKLLNNDKDSFVLTEQEETIFKTLKPDLQAALNKIGMVRSQ